jgi:integrase
VSLMKRGNVYWAYFYIDGVRFQRSTGTGNKRQAQTIEQQLKEEANDDRHQVVRVDPRITVAAVVASFLADGQPKSHHHYQLTTLLPYFGDTEVVRLRRNMAREYREWRKKLKPKTSDATVNRALSVLRHILYWAVDESLIRANPLARLPLVRERRLKRPVMTVAEEELLLAAVPGYLKRIVIAALDTGMRRGEILKQRWENIDISRKVLAVTRAKTVGGEAREVPLSSRLFDLLVEDPKADGPVFTRYGKSLNWIRKGWLGALKRAGLRHFRFHDLRHTFNTRLMEAGVLQEIRMALMGHSVGAKVHATYTHIELPVKREAIRKLEAWITNQKNQMNKEKKDGCTETERSESNPDESANNGQVGAQTVGKEVAGRRGLGTSRQAESRNRGDGGRAESQKTAIGEVRTGPQAVRSELGRETAD